MAPKTTDTTSQRWLFVTGFPVLAGTLSAMALMFNICTLLSEWEVADDKRPFPRCHRMVALQAVSLVIAVITYIAYALQMRRHRRPSYILWLVILGWLVPAVLLFSVIGVVVQRHTHLPSHLHREYTQAFYYGVFAAALYGLVSLLLVGYIVGAPKIHLNRHDGRCVQRTGILLRAVALAVILLLGAAIFHATEGWPLLDALYFADFTILTIGIGNLAPTTHLGRSLLFPYATAGIVSLGLMVSAVLSFAREMRNMKLRLRMAQMRESWRCQTEKQKESALQAMHVREIHRIKDQFHRAQVRRELVFFLLAWFVLWFLSAAVFRVSESQQGWSYFVALYFTFTSLTTIGYGDFYPTSSCGKAFFVFWSLLALPILTNLVTAMGQTIRALLVTVSAALWRHGVACVRLRHKGCLSASRRKRLPRVESHGASAETTGSMPRNLHHLLIVEEMDRMVSILREPGGEDELEVLWSRVLPLLHTDDGEETSPGPFHPHRPRYMARLMDPHLEMENRHLEMLWMLTFLIRRLRADLENSPGL
ncbi:hypothetical protein ASPZODRAFT_105185 [Penicilliopsis zonata CBS 506.65]|uniref:Potassium channel domain-containing protein n=1 Tax=Penicilliopsis zonata CBS 506.65 TaxID=1073090 RepID=A0A1L9S5P5_9EURO|nr:hypothetical protein ASPZODRAFT_105185 [Penicilliopsis zonata CBS 506.65]OJJ42477.1 hypothetical protein ASPZODRAFT_105185 [Penicilliopsis zonata CBS 506.65]